jgi:hypothetical protein
MPTFVLSPTSPKLEDCSLVLFEKTKEESNRHAYSSEHAKEDEYRHKRKQWY